MHSLTPLLTCLLVACNDTAYRSLGGPSTEAEGEMVTISGIVTDSLLGGTIPGVRVAAGRYVTEADVTGGWSLKVPKGPVTLSTSPEGYERTTYAFEARASSFVNLQARREAPAAYDCVQVGSTLTALVSDLQGRKSLERWSRSEAIVQGRAGSHRIGAINWGYEALDYITWKITLTLTDPEVTVVNWNLYDSEGHRYTGACEPVVVTGEQ